jgi:hypothetical protein
MPRTPRTDTAWGTSPHWLHGQTVACRRSGIKKFEGVGYGQEVGGLVSRLPGLGSW